MQRRRASVHGCANAAAVKRPMVGEGQGTGRAHGRCSRARTRREGCHLLLLLLQGRIALVDDGLQARNLLHSGRHRARFGSDQRLPPPSPFRNFPQEWQEA